MKDLAPKLLRQRVVIEGTTETVVGPEEISKFLFEFSKIVKMRVLSGPFSYPAEDMGFGGWIHWVTSGAHFYSYTTNPPLFTLDAYTCKAFSVEEAVEFTKNYFNSKQIIFK